MYRIRYFMKHPRFIFFAVYWIVGLNWIATIQLGGAPFSIHFIAGMFSVPVWVMISVWLLTGLMALLPGLPPIAYTMLAAQMAGHALVTGFGAISGNLPTSNLAGFGIYAAASLLMQSVVFLYYDYANVIRTHIQNGKADADDH